MNILSILVEHKNKLFLLVVVGILSISYFNTTTPFSRYEEVNELKKIAQEEKWGGEEYANYLEDIAKEKGGEYAYEILRRAEFSDGTDLHLLGHVVGDVLYTQEGIDAIHICTPEFRNACSHTIVVGLFDEHGEEALDDISEVCRKAPGGSGAYTMCFHGLGHGVLAYNNYDFEDAVAMCEKTGTEEYNNREYAECVGGGVMELIGGVHDRVQWEKQVQNYLKKNDPLSPCNAPYITSGDVQRMCYSYITPSLFIHVGMDLGNPQPAYFEEAFRFCNLLPEDDYSNRSACYSGFGKEFVGLAQGRDIRIINDINEESLLKMHKWCELSDSKEGEIYCALGALSSLFWGGENDSSIAFNFCELGNKSTKDPCYEQLGGTIKYYIRDESMHKSLCERLPKEHQYSCF